MHSQTILAPLTILLLVVTVVSVYSKIQENSATTFSRQDELLAKAASNPEPAARDLSSLLNGGAGPLLLAGVSPIVPNADDYPVISEVPWDVNQVSSLYRNAGQLLACEVLGPGVPLTQPLAAPAADNRAALGRTSAFSIKLQLDPIWEDELPRVTRGAVSSYLENHQLTIQPTLYQSGDGQAFFGPKLKAAFTGNDGTGTTVEPEPMVASAVTALRTLGMLWESGDEFALSSARTMILAFRYTTEERTPAAPDGTSHREFELLFIHKLADSTAQNPRYAVFATSAARTQFHLLDTADPTSESSAPAVSATIRFGSMTTMGMYPAAPVVTGVSHRSLLTLPVETVRSQMFALAKEKTSGFAAFLDSIHERGQSEAAAAAAQ